MRYYYCIFKLHILWNLSNGKQKIINSLDLVVLHQKVELFS